ncbi:M48 family metallopeptidase [Rhodohalobacter mucosus]|uniref:Metal-dependent hydrolase n=1 Tax=Rhodohalobacter mucosus TaxID=2079485 RepID=A0A316TQ96_9BACT|nr:SprT family zinc-dependent metalloprotease [Rhodohalobacter mucosus]PWN06777.1 metal-dependent hydrolase [Rhodohalobacter mucosus]
MFWKKKKSRITRISCGDLDVEVRQKQIRNFYLRVYPDEGNVVLSAPIGAALAEMEAFIENKREWISRHLSQKKRRQTIDTLRAREGETVPVWGVQNRVRYKRTKPRSANVYADETLMLGLLKGDGEAEVHRLLCEFYRKEMKQKIPEIISVYEQRMGVRVNEFGVKKMKTRWGSCNTRANRIWLNLELALYSPSVLEFVVVHEMVHLLERLHNRRFYRFMDHYLPDWRKQDGLLKNGHEIC